MGFAFLFLTLVAQGNQACDSLYAMVRRQGVQAATLQVKGRPVYYQWVKAEPSKGTVLLLNGLMVRQEGWHQYMQDLAAKGYSSVSMAFSGQPESLVGLKGPLPVHLQEPITANQLVEEARAVLSAVKASGPVHLQGYSFGAMAAIHFAQQHPKEISTVTLVAPMTKALHNYMPQAQMAQSAMDQMQNLQSSLFDPFGFLGVKNQWEAQRQSQYRSTVRQTLANEVAGEDYVAGVERAFFEAGIVELTMGAREFDLGSYSASPLPLVHMILPKEEFYSQMREHQLAFYRSLPVASRGALVVMDRFGHNDVLGAARTSMISISDQLMNGKPSNTAFQFDTQAVQLQRSP
jgi:pimeloyl-ACP methyl ester carboxylesterase